MTAMETTSPSFKENARKAIADPLVARSRGHIKAGFIGKRRKAADRLPEFEALRDAARDIKDHTLAHLDHYLERFEEKVTATGGTVHWCQTPAEARQVILELCRAVDAKTATKSKSMIAEEMALNPFLEAHGIEPVETDLGEYIIQLADERPSHIIAPAIHKTRDQVADLFHEKHTPPDVLTAIESSIPMKRLGTPEDCVGTYLYLASDALSGYVTGQVVEVNGGQLMP